VKTNILLAVFSDMEERERRFILHDTTSIDYFLPQALGSILFLTSSRIILNYWSQKRRFPMMERHGTPVVRDRRVPVTFSTN